MPIRLAISEIVIEGVSRQASRIIPDVFPTLSRRFPDPFPTLSRQASGGIGLRCHRIFKQLNRDTAGSFSDDGTCKLLMSVITQAN